MVVFLIFSFTGYYLLIILWGSFASQQLSRNVEYRLGTDDFMYTRVREVKEVKDVDMLVVGSSHAYQGFDIRIFKKSGISVFNLGSNVQTPIQTRLLLNRYLERLNPETIIYEVYPMIFYWDGVRSALGLIANDQNDLHSIKMAFEVDHMKVYNTLLYGFFRDAFGLNKSFVDTYSDRKYVSGGYVEKDLRYFKHIDHSPKEYEFNEDQLTAFKEIIEMIRQKKIRLILVYAPITPSLYNSYTNNEVFDSLMNSHGEYYNFNEIVSLDDSLHFDEDDHLNQRGVKIFNEKFLKIIHEN